MSTLLPEGFEALEPFVETWNIQGSNNRKQQRLDSSEAEREAFFNAAKDLAQPGLELLDQKPLGDLDEKEQRLMNVLLSLAHVALAVEIQGDDEPFHARYAKFITITQSTADASTPPA